MARIAGVDLPRDKQIEYALPYIYGIGLASSRQILAEAEVAGDTRVKDLAETEIIRLRSILESGYKVEGLPVRGQGTKTNARSRKGPRRTVAGKKKAPRK